MSTVRITYGENDALDITSHVIFEDARFEMQMNAMPGTCSFRVKDPTRSYSFTTGREIRLYIDGAPVWGGYLRRINMTYAFPADDTSNPSNYANRIWQLEGADYNILFDNRIIRRTDDYTSHVPHNTGYEKDTMDGWALWKLLYSFSDFPSGFDITSDRADATNIDNITTVLPSSATSNFRYSQQGTKLRDEFDSLAKMAAAVFYIGAEKSVHWHAYEQVQKLWGFSDDPNRTVLSTPGLVPGESTWPFHEVTGEEDGTLLVNDAIIWGGSPIGSDGDVIVARMQEHVDGVDPVGASRSSATVGNHYIESGAVEVGSSIYEHGRWQLGEVHTEGGSFGGIMGVKARAQVVVDGPPGATGDGILKGLKYPQWMFSFSWWAHDVPLLSEVHNHIRAGDIIRVQLAAFGVDQFVPCRTVRISFPELDSDGDAYVLFSGDFSLVYTDPIALWKGIMETASNYKDKAVTQIVSVNDGSTETPYGAYGTFTPLELPDGVLIRQTPSGRVTFHIKFPYIPESMDVYINGLLQRRDEDFWETDPVEAEFVFSSPPMVGDLIVVQCRTLAT
jgi:hypothetical protein